VLLWDTHDEMRGKVCIESFNDARTLKALALSSPFFSKQKREESEMLAIASGETVRMSLISTLESTDSKMADGDEGDKEGAKGVLRLGGEALAMAFSPRCACH